MLPLIPLNVMKLREESEQSFIPLAINPDANIYLRHGWLNDQLINSDNNLWRRWNFHSQITEDPDLVFSKKIPQITFRDLSYPTLNMLEYCLNMIPCGQWDADNRGWLYLEYFLDWLLFAFGYHANSQLPVEPEGAKGASNRLYQTFQLFPLQLWPYDYFGEILLRSKFSDLAEDMGILPHEMIAAEVYHSCYDVSHDELFPVSAASTGRYLLHLSNYTVNAIAQELDPTLLKICLVNCYLYAPWFIFPIEEKNPYTFHWVGDHLVPEFRDEEFYSLLTNSAEEWSDYITEENYDDYIYLHTEFDAENWWRYAPFLKRRYINLPKLYQETLSKWGAVQTFK